MSVLRIEVPSWRLSRIEEEIEGINVNDDSPQKVKSLPGSREGTLCRGEGFPPPPEFPLPPYPSTGSSGVSEEDIYSKAFLDEKERQMGDMYAAKEAARFLTEKYDSLGRIHNKPPSPLPPPPPESSSPSLIQGYGTFPGARKQREGSSRNSSVSSEEFHHVPTPPPQMEDLCCLPEPQPPSTTTYNPYGGLDNVPLSDQEIIQVEMFYRSHKTDVFVSQCVVHLYMGSARGSPCASHLPNMAGVGAMPDSEGENWAYMKSGVLVVVMDSGESRRTRKLNIVLAERGTGFVLWKESMNHLTNYQAPQPCFQTMHLSNDHTKLAGFRFHDATAAVQFHQKICMLTSDPQDSALRLSGGKNSKKSKEKKSKGKPKQKLPSKADISSPCCFTHVTKLDRTDGMCMLSNPLPAAPSRQVTMSPGQKLRLPHQKHK